MGKNVLIVDDSSFMRNILKDILTDGGYTIAGEASDGKQALELYRKLRPDIVTMDIVLPDKSGIDVVKEIRKTDSNAKIVMVTALGQQQLVSEAISAGASDFITKPFQREKILEVIKKLEV